ncbi:MAG: hypothetical protein UDO63_01905 [Oscillospiraceae bacterium]|jgi:hypothetical protein
MHEFFNAIADALTDIGNILDILAGLLGKALLVKMALKTLKNSK